MYKGIVKVYKQAAILFLRAVDMMSEKIGARLSGT
jgi:hypothetical protein